jgi:hypothetical protein
VDLNQAEQRLRRLGYYHDVESGVSVKIIPWLGGYGVETIVNGDRRMPIEAAMPMEEARRLALAQLLEPRGHYEYTPTRETVREASPKRHMPYREVSKLMASYKRRGLGDQDAWRQFIIDTVLQPICKSEPMDAKEFFQHYRRSS